VAELKGHQGEPYVVAFNRDGTLLASSAWDGYSRLWDCVTWQSVLGPPLNNGSVKFSGTGRLLGMFHRHGQAGLIEVAGAREVRLLAGHQRATKNQVRCASFSLDARLMASVADDGLRLWDTDTWEQIARLPDHEIRGATFHPLRKYLLTAGRAGLHRWPIQVEADSRRRPQIGPPVVLIPEMQFAKLALSADATVLMALREDGSVFVLSPETTNHWVVIDVRSSAAAAVLSPDGRWVATGTFRGNGVKIWDTKSGEFWRELPVVGGASVEFSPDGSWLLTGSSGMCQFWDTKTWQAVRRVERQHFAGFTVTTAISPDAKIVAMMQTSSEIRLLSARSGATLAVFDGSYDIPLTFSPDGGRLVSAAENGMIRVWDLMTIHRQLSEIGLGWHSL